MCFSAISPTLFINSKDSLKLLKVKIFTIESISKDQSFKDRPKVFRKNMISRPRMGTLASIISKSNELPEGTFILSLAQMDTNKTKVSLRISGKNDRDRDLRAIIKKITDEVGGEAGGHVDAAGAIIPIEKEEAFIDVAKKILKREHIEERVV